MRDLTVWDTPTKIMNGLFDFGNYDRDFSENRLRVDWDTTEDGYVVRAEVPGVVDEDLDVNFENGVLSIRAEYKEENKNSIRRGKYQWSARVQDVDSDAIEAHLDRGILTLTLPKNEKAKPKKIDIKRS